jgi:hypothetical protein
MLYLYWLADLMKGVLEEVGEVSSRLNSSHSEHTDTLRPCTHAHNLP